MSLTQFQIIQSLGRHLELLQTELSWGSSAQELRHLTGRIGELYAAMVTYGQMAPENNQRGYDVVSLKGERISVKTITSSNHVSFNAATLQYVDSIMILRINTTRLEIETLVDKTVENAKSEMRLHDKKYVYAIGKNLGNQEPNVESDSNQLQHLQINQQLVYGEYVIQQYENGTIQVLQDGNVLIAWPVLANIASALNVSLLNSAGSKKNTRQLGDHVIKAIEALHL